MLAIHTYVFFHYALPDEEDGAEEKWEKRISAFAKSLMKILRI
ncbi:MAG: hypothetical protein CM15mP49_13700 [Actinomycetota bacterium]|nr:MAG: hypothetical protein CM15mP49_13700 [Actinomycetota bacterium]